MQVVISEQHHSVKYTVAVGHNYQLFNEDKRRPKIDRVGPREVGEANGGGGLPWVAAEWAVEDQNAQIENVDGGASPVADRSWGWVQWVAKRSRMMW